jgi:hypothetical protein
MNNLGAEKQNHEQSIQSLERWQVVVIQIEIW